MGWRGVPPMILKAGPKHVKSIATNSPMFNNFHVISILLPYSYIINPQSMLSIIFWQYLSIRHPRICSFTRDEHPACLSKMSNNSFNFIYNLGQITNTTKAYPIIWDIGLAPLKNTNQFQWRLFDTVPHTFSNPRKNAVGYDQWSLSPFIFGWPSGLCSLSQHWHTVKSLISARPNPQTQMFLVLSWSCLCPIQWSQVLSGEWRCSRSSADRRCSNFIWVINNFIA